VKRIYTLLIIIIILVISYKGFLSIFGKINGEVIFYIVLLVPLIWLTIELIRRDNKETKEQNLKHLQKVDVISNFLKNLEDFTLSDYCINVVRSAFLGIDEIQRKIIIGEYDDESDKFVYRIVQAKDVLGIEITEDGKGILSSSVNKNIFGMAAIGGLIFGGAGAIVGALAGSNIKTKISELSLKLAIDDIKTPFIGINFMGKTVISKGSDTYKDSYKFINEWFEKIMILLEREKRGNINS